MNKLKNLMTKLNFLLIAFGLPVTFSSSHAVAQQRNIDMELIMKSPAEDSDFDLGTDIPLELEVKNLGPDTLIGGDMLFVYLPDRSLVQVDLKQTLTTGQSATIVSRTITITETGVGNICSQIMSDPNGNGSSVDVGYKDSNPSNNEVCHVVKVSDPKGNDIDRVDEEQKYLSIWPNPTQGNVTIESKSGLYMQSVSIYNMLGAQVYQTSGNGQSKQILDLVHLAPAVYLMHINTNQRILVRKLNLVH